MTAEERRIAFFGNNDARAYDADEIFLMNEHAAKTNHKKYRERNVKLADAKKVCKITNGKHSWVIEVDGQTIMFNWSHNAEYFRDHYTALNYLVIFTDL